MQHLTSCLTKCEDTLYRNWKDHLPAIALAHCNIAFNSAMKCTPFEAMYPSTQSLLDRKRRRAMMLVATPRTLPAVLPPPRMDRRLSFESPFDRKGARVPRLARRIGTSMGTGTSPVIPGEKHATPRSTPVPQEIPSQVH